MLFYRRLIITYFNHLFESAGRQARSARWTHLLPKNLTNTLISVIYTLRLCSNSQLFSRFEYDKLYDNCSICVIFHNEGATGSR